MKKILLVIFAIVFLCGGVLPTVEDYIDEVANSKEVLTFFNKKDSPEKLKKFIASVNKKLSNDDVDRFARYILTYSKQYDVDYKLVAAVIAQESKFKVNAKSRVGALGLMQVMPTTGKNVAQKLKIPSYNLLDPKDNIQIGVKFISMLYREYKGDINLMLAHYNGGYRQAELYKTFRYFELMRLITMHHETFDYVKKVKANYRKISREF
ncbi:MAG: lytic transglycosylase domain-containing protein [Fibrobacter sp.]|nr:lytic transglycosylase domain-containing protein [Fibrobacter sp.]